jgi:uncharacterized cupredoxin-like copper-binding protein
MTAATALGGIAVVALTACGATIQPAGYPMMSGNGTGQNTTIQPGGPGMMGGVGDSGYTASRLSCSAPAALPGRTVTVTLADMGMTSMMSGTAPLGAPMILRATPTTVVAGQIRLVAQNVGWRTHELVILPMKSGSAAGRLVPGTNGKIDENGSLGEASPSCGAGPGQGSTVGWTTVTLPPGRYELVCDLANHYADGMHQEFDVTAR